MFLYLLSESFARCEDLFTNRLQLLLSVLGPFRRTKNCDREVENAALGGIFKTFVSGFHYMDLPAGK